MLDGSDGSDSREIPVELLVIDGGLEDDEDDDWDDDDDIDDDDEWDDDDIDDEDDYDDEDEEDIPEAMMCRDDSCDIEHLHRAHPVPLRRRKKRGVIKRDWDTDGLRLSVISAVCCTDWAQSFVDVYHRVVNDYGSVSERALHRHLRSAAADGQIVILEDLGLPVAAYVSPRSRYLRDVDSLRDHVLGRRASWLEGRAGLAAVR